MDKKDKIITALSVLLILSLIGVGVLSYLLFFTEEEVTEDSVSEVALENSMEDSDSEETSEGEAESESDSKDTSSNEEEGETVVTLPEGMCEDFSMKVPTDWDFYNSIDNKNYITSLGFTVTDNDQKYIMLLEKDVYTVYIGSIVTETSPKSGGIFSDDEELEEFKEEHTVVSIDGEEYYLPNKHTPLSNLTDPNIHGGVIFSSAMENITEDGVVNEQGTVYDARTTDLYQKPCNYIISKFAEVEERGETDPEIQQEIVDILETITW
jgi:hypothetical protein